MSVQLIYLNLVFLYWMIQHENNEFNIFTPVVCACLYEALQLKKNQLDKVLINNSTV